MTSDFYFRDDCITIECRSYKLPALRHQISGHDMRIYLQEKNDWDSTTWDTIDWYGFEKAIKSRPPVMQRRISKFVNGWWNTGKQR